MAMLNNQMVYHNDDNWLVVLNPSEKSESQLGLLLPIYGTIKHVPNHPADNDDHDYDLIISFAE